MRIAQGYRRNWLIFGERNRRCDYFCREEIESYRRDGELQELDLVFSRDQCERIYVQHFLVTEAATLRDWVQQDAAIYVGGSLRGMAPGVDAGLREILGNATVAAMIRDGCYRRDVYSTGFSIAVIPLRRSISLALTRAACAGPTRIIRR